MVNISPYEYPHPERENSSEYTIAIFHTNDFHGYALPNAYTDIRTNEKYYNGSIEYLSSFIDIIRNEWKDRFIWVDGGDHGFGGGYEFLLSNGTLMTDFFKFKNLTATTLGNHEFNKGVDFLMNHMKNSSFDYLVANIEDKATKKNIFMPNQHKSKIYQVSKVKVGIIGLTHIKIPYDNKKITTINFLPYRDIIIRESALLKQQGVNAIILLAHFGPLCNNQKGFEDKFILKMRNIKTKQANCVNFDGIIDLIESLPPKTIDALLSGHIHRVTHHWIKNIPVISSNGGSYANVVYLHFNNNNMQLKYIDTEGPIPICSKIFSIGKHCKYISNYKELDSPLGSLSEFMFHGVKIIKDININSITAKWKKMMIPLQVPICYTEIELERDLHGETILQNMIGDACRKITKAEIAIIHSDTLRTKWFPGELNEIDMYHMFPYDNRVCSIEMTGREIIRTFNDIITEKNKFYFTSGIIVRYYRHPTKLHSVVIFDGEYKDIEEGKMYKVATFDYLLKGNIEFAKVMKWYTPRNMKCYSYVRDEIGKFLKEVKVIKANSFIDPLHPRIQFVN